MSTSLHKNFFHHNTESEISKGSSVKMVIRAVCHQFGTGFKTECNAAVSSDLSIIAYIFNTKQQFLRNSRRQFRWNSAADCKRSLSRSHEVQRMINARNVYDRRHFGREFCLWAQFRLTLIIIVCILSLTQQNFYFVALEKGPIERPRSGSSPTAAFKVEIEASTK